MRAGGLLNVRATIALAGLLAAAVLLPTFKASNAAADPPSCFAGARSLSTFGARLYPEMGNGGYTSVHTDVFLNYDALTNLFLPGTHVDLTAALDAVPERLQPRLRAHERRTPRRHRPEHDRQLGHGQRPAGDVQVRAADLPGRPERPGRSRPARARRSRTRTRSTRPTRTRPPARRRSATRAQNGTAVPGEQARDHAVGADPERHDFTVTVNYTGRPGVHADGDGSPRAGSATRPRAARAPSSPPSRSARWPGCR